MDGFQFVFMFTAIDEILLTGELRVSYNGQRTWDIKIKEE